MIYFKISFLIVLISVVCFSDAVKTKNEALIDKINCRNAMKTTFEGIRKSTRHCIQHAILYMKLHGNYAFLYDKHIEKYYKLFHKSVHIDSVILPEQFCIEKGQVLEILENCLNQLRIFKEPPTFPDDEEQIEEGTSQSNPIILDSSSSQNIFHTKEDLDKWLDSDNWDDFQQIINEEDSEPPVSEGDLNKWLDSDNWDDFQQIIKADVVPKDSKAKKRRIGDNQINLSTLKRNVLKNALYLHVIYEPKKGYSLPVDQESRKCFHEVSTDGYKYLSEIARRIQFKKGSLMSPFEFCDQQYFKDLKDIEEERKRL